VCAEGLLSKGREELDSDLDNDADTDHDRDDSDEEDAVEQDDVRDEPGQLGAEAGGGTAAAATANGNADGKNQWGGDDEEDNAGQISADLPPKVKPNVASSSCVYVLLFERLGL